MDQSSKIVLLFDYFSMESRNLYESFTNVGIPFTAAVVEDDGFLPEGVNSVYGYFCTQGAVAREEHPRYFNQIQVPEYWRIESTNTSGKVMDKTKERARIFYTEPTNHRLVKLAHKSINIATMQLYRAARGGMAVMVIECDQEIPEEGLVWLRRQEGIRKVTYLSLR